MVSISGLWAAGSDEPVERRHFALHMKKSHLTYAAQCKYSSGIFSFSLICRCVAGVIPLSLPPGLGWPTHLHPGIRLKCPDVWCWAAFHTSGREQTASYFFIFLLMLHRRWRSLCTLPGHLVPAVTSWKSPTCNQKKGVRQQNKGHIHTQVTVSVCVCAWRPHAFKWDFLPSLIKGWKPFLRAQCARARQRNKREMADNDVIV